MRLKNEIISELRCPVCFDKLIQAENYLICLNINCSTKYPIVNHIPVLIDANRSIFSIDDYINHKGTTFNLEEGKIKSFVKKFVPSNSNNIKAKINYKKLLSLLIGRSYAPKVLIIGGSILGDGIQQFVLDERLILVESDVSFGPRTQIIFDAHNIPFPDNFFDCVILQAVLEHVVDPFNCVQEVYRVLKMDGLVYAETPFMQQVHMGKYDFHRFTHLGHRRLFRNFTEIESGAVNGPGMALAWAYSHFIFSFFNSKRIRNILIPITRFTSFFWKYFDYILINKPGVFDSASGYFFIGKKSESPLDDRDLLKLYRGLL
jgi:SAM-dependent methyltransferase/uncharacterized protein YbaR (Trm112 family)